MKILIYIQWPVKAWSITDASAERIYKAFPDVEFVRVHTLDDAARAIADVDAAFTPIMRPEMVASATQLRWVHTPAAAVEGLLPLAELAAHDILVTNSKGIQGIAIAEHVMAGILALSRRIDRMILAQRERKWIQNDLTNDWPWTLHGQRMTIVGLGTIGMEVAKRAHAFGIHVTGVRRNIDQPIPDYVDAVVSPEGLNAALENCDLLVLAAPGISTTRRMIGAHQLSLLNRNAVLVNVARANIVDDGAMRSALASRQLGGAVLDVFEREPLEESDALWATPNVIVTPHSSGFRSTHWADVTALFIDNLERFMQHKPLLNAVDLSAGY
jgi:phosphoglycerate dehydrogenase-like enzyme